MTSRLETIKFRHSYHKLAHDQFTTIRGKAQFKRLKVGQAVLLEIGNKVTRLSYTIAALELKRVKHMPLDFLKADAEYPGFVIHSQQDFIDLLNSFRAPAWTKVTPDTELTIITLRRALVETTQPPAYTEGWGRKFVFNDHVCIEMLRGVPDEKRTGRLVQVRKKAGAFGSDIYLIRLRDGSLASFENALIRHANDQRFEDSFYRSNGKNPPVIPEQPVRETDSVDAEYTIADQWPETGFLIEQPTQPPSTQQSFSMIITKKS